MLIMFFDSDTESLVLNGGQTQYQLFSLFVLQIEVHLTIRGLGPVGIEFFIFIGQSQSQAPILNERFRKKS